MNRRHLLGVVFITSSMGCQSRPHAAADSQSASLSLSPATITRLAKAGIPNCTRVAAYAINRRVKVPSPNATLVIDGRLNPDRHPLEGRALTDRQVNAFLDATTGNEHAGTPSYCFYPHHSIAFYKADAPLSSHYTICFSCQTHSASAGKFVDQPNFRALNRLFEEVKLR
jgi:hypothetical protein